MRFRVSPVLMVCGVVVMASGCATLSPPRHPAFKERAPQLRSFGILPPRVSVVQLTFNGSEPMYDLLPHVEETLVEGAQKALTDRGYTVARYEMPTTQPSADPRLYTAQLLFDRHIAHYYGQPPTQHQPFTYTLGSLINPFADATSADAVVFLRCHGFKKSRGEIAADWMKTLLIGAATLGQLVVVQYPSVALVQVGIVDGNTGDLLWYEDNAGTPQLDPANDDQLHRAVAALLAKFP